MFTLIVILALVVLISPVLAIAALLSVNGVQQAVRGLESRVRALERGPAAAAPASPAPAPPPAAPPAAPVAASSSPALLQSATTTPIPPPPAPPPPPSTKMTSVPPSPAPSVGLVGFEEQVGTRWFVWIGGIALALGGIFLVRYTIEQGLIGPRVRIMLGALLALALVAAGEWQRRKEKLSHAAKLPSANIPSILTAAGTTVAYATIYAAYAIYGFLSPPLAFVLLGVVALLTLGAALLHGAVLAGLGVIGAYLTPMLVTSAEPDFWALYVFVAVINAAAFALARLRLWPLIGLLALVLGALWALPGIDSPLHTVTALNAHVFHAVTGFALAATFLVCGIFYGPPAVPNRIDFISTLALSIYLLVATLLVLASHHDPVALTAFVILSAATVGIAWRTEPATAAVPVAAILATAIMAHWAAQIEISHLLAPSGPAAPAIPEPDSVDYGWHFAVAALWAALFGVAGFLAQGRSLRALVPMLWCATGVATPLAMLIALYYRIEALDRSLPFAALALLLAAVFGVATETLVRREQRPGLMAASAIFATGSLAALALALTFALEKGWLTVGLALMAPASAWVAEKRPLPWLRWFASAIVTIIVARTLYDPRIVGTDLGTTPIFNWLLYGYGVPAASFWLAGWILRKRADDLPARTVDAGAILFTVLLAVSEIRHYVGGGDLYRWTNWSMELMLDINAGLAISIGLERVRGRTGSIVHNVGALVVAALTLMAIIPNLFEAMQMQFAPVHAPFFNVILLGYGLPAVLAVALALIARTTRPMSYRVIAVLTAVTLALFYLTLEVRRLFHGVTMSGAVGDAEQYVISTVWLTFGIALLAVGFVLRSQPARLLALGVITLTVAKVFIVDTADISGIYRALSVTGLGVVLLGIGALYQRVIYPRSREAASAP